MSDGVLSAKSFRSFARASKSFSPTPVIALLKLAERSDSCLQLPAVAIDDSPEELEVEVVASVVVSALSVVVSALVVVAAAAVVVCAAGGALLLAAATCGGDDECQHRCREHE